MEPATIEGTRSPYRGASERDLASAARGASSAVPSLSVADAMAKLGGQGEPVPQMPAGALSGVADAAKRVASTAADAGGRAMDAGAQTSGPRVRTATEDANSHLSGLADRLREVEFRTRVRSVVEPVAEPGLVKAQTSETVSAWGQAARPMPRARGALEGLEALPEEAAATTKAIRPVDHVTYEGEGARRPMERAHRERGDGKIALKAYGSSVMSEDYGFIGSAVRTRRQMAAFRDTRAAVRNGDMAGVAEGTARLRDLRDMDARTVLGKGVVARGIAAADREGTRSFLKDDGGRNREADTQASNSFDYSVRRQDRKVSRGAKAVVRARMQGKGALGTIKEGVIGYADTDWIDAPRNVVRSARSAVGTAKNLAARYRNLRTRFRNWKARNKAAGGMMRRYAQAMSRRVSKAASIGKVVRGMRPNQVARAVVRAVQNAAVKIIVAVASLIGALVSTLAMVLLPIILVAVLVSVVINFFFAQPETGSLQGLEQQIAASLKADGFSDAATAAVLANVMSESDANPASDEVLDKAVFAKGHYVYERACGLFQYTYASNDVTPEDDYARGGTQEYTRFKHWAADNNKNWADATVQMEWTFSGQHPEGYFGNRWGTNLVDSGYYSNSPGFDKVSRVDRTADEFKQETDSTVAAFSWMACYEKPSNGDVAQLERRINLAMEYQAKLQSNSGVGTGQEYQASSDEQKAIVNAALTTQFAGEGLCALWVGNVMDRVGIGNPGGNANDMYWRFCTSADRSELKVGMIVAVPTWSGSAAGRVYGHVGIYVGDGKVMSNTVGKVETQTLDDFIGRYGDLAQVKWGFISRQSDR